MKQKIYAAVLIVYVIVLGSLNKNFKTEFYSIQNSLYFIGLGIIAYMFFKHTNKDTFNKLSVKLGVYFFIVGCLIIYFAFSK